MMGRKFCAIFYCDIVLVALFGMVASLNVTCGKCDDVHRPKLRMRC